MSLESPEDVIPDPLGQGGTGPPARRVLDDPVVLRALAHPLRLSLHRLLIREGSCSAAYAARELGISQALASHHLHQLSKYGFAEQLPGRDRRERPWRALSTSTTWLGADTTDEGAVAADILEQTLAEQSISNLLEWQRRRRSPEQRDWHDVAGLDTSLLYLTSEEADELGKAFDALCRRFITRRIDLEERAARMAPVELTLMLVPLTPTTSGS
jgi:predicted ArsR family transcriptional regulator